MKIAIVDICWKEICGPNPLNEPQGGSETWLIQISREFARQGNTIDVYCWTQKEFNYENVRYIPDYHFLECTEKYDFIILNRFFEKEGVNYIEFIKNHNLAKHVYIQIHDLSFVIDGTLLDEGEDVNKYSLNDDFVTVVTLNEWHRKNLLAQYHSITKLPICIPNGLDLSLFKDEKLQRDNRILWSSCSERGLNILINDIYPIVKQEIPDFGIDVAGYNDDVVIDTEYDVVYLGRLSKHELYHEQQKHKVWFYPGTFAETFCITMLEHIMNGTQVVSPFTFGTEPTIGYAEEIRMSNRFDRSEKEYDEAVKEAAEKIIGILKSTEPRPYVYGKILHKIKTEYNWTNSVNLYLRDFETVKQNTEKSILILTMSCNNNYFQALLAGIKETWAKPIIQGKYKNVKWFGYTSCNEKHPNSCIDYDDHMIYVDVPDDLYHTYEKTQEAYKLINNAGISADYIVRTNSSVYVNVDLLVDKVNMLNNNDILGGICGYYHSLPDGKVEFIMNIIIGFFFGMPKWIFETAYSGTHEYDTIPTSDDIRMSYVLEEKIKDQYNVINPDTFEHDFPRYKVCTVEDLPTMDEEVQKQYIDDPDIVNTQIVTRFRPNYGEMKDRAEKGHEFEHLFELHNALKISMK